AYLLGFFVVGVVEAGRQRISADHNAAFYFRTEAFTAGALVQVVNILRVVAAVAKAYTVHARQVGGAFSRRNDVIGRNRQVRVRQRNRFYLRTQLFVFGNGVTHGLLHVGA